MASLKYFERIEELLAADQLCAGDPLPPFDFDALGSRSAFARGLTRFLLRRLLPALAFILRQLWPNPRLGRVILVTRAADAIQVLQDMTHFRVVYTLEMKDLGGGTTNLLAEDEHRHEALRKILDIAFKREDLARISVSVAEDAAALLTAGAGRIDVIRDLVSRTASEAACRFFGLTANDPDVFGQWTMALSNQIFGDFTGDANVHRQAKTASAHLCGLVDDAIARLRANDRLHPHGKRERTTLIDRLLGDPNATDAQIRATIVGLATAFIPTNTLAAGNILEVLLDKPALLRAARAAARTNDADAMRHILLEAGRLNPALSPGLWRHVPDDVEPVMIGKGWQGQRTRKGDLILVCIPSALRDGRGIGSDEDRKRRNWMMFGTGPHDCWGAELALAHLVPVFIALFKLPGLRCAPGKDGSMLRVGAFPVRMDMVYDAPQAKRAMILVTLPVRHDVPRSAVEAAIDALGNPARPDVAITLKLGDRVQFASLSVIERAPDSTQSILILEISGDGDENDLLCLIAHHCFAWLSPVVGFSQTADTAEALAEILRRGHVVLKQRPFGKTGLHFDGMSELSVTDIARQERVAAFARKVIDNQLKHELGLNTRAMGLLLRTRRLIRGDTLLALRRRNRILIAVARRLGLRAAPLRPSRKRLAIADWQGSDSLWSGAKAMLAARENRFIPLGFLAILILWFAGLLAWLAPTLDNPVGYLMIGPVAFALAIPLTVATVAAPLAVLAAWLRWHERRDVYDERAAPLDHVQAIAKREDAPGHVQNHIIAVMPFKQGLLRKLTFAFAMWGIRQTVSYFFRPGFVLTMGTIHKARWFRVPGTEQFVFFSNYDGSWESYLEDFITRAHEGQSAAWTHGVGFPPTRFLILDGASDGDRFKRWVRLQQRETRFWFSRFPHLTAQQIRNNAIIEDGLARATSDTDARRWLSCFGSAQREPDELETQEAQSIVFSGLSSLPDSTALMLRLPDSKERAGQWLSAISGLRAYVPDALIPPPERWSYRDHSANLVVHLPIEARILFGDQSHRGGGATLGFTASGLERCGFDHANGLDTLPSAFRMTMAARARLLGDKADEVAEWRFSDDASRSQGVHAMIMLYGHETNLPHADLVNGHIQLLRYFGGAVVHRIDCKPVKGSSAAPSLDTEPFGFRDGISQPVIRGTRRATHAPPERDLVAAGEFLLGYRNHQGYLSSPVMVGAERDPACELPTISAAHTNRYPWFGNRDSGFEPRDFGRNGTFMAVRQLDQDTEGFWKQAEWACQAILKDFKSLPELAGAQVSSQWVAAKIIGRWPDGTPLVGNQEYEQGVDPSHSTENDFAYGVDDPRGLACPLGAHIRRANPRDSQEPGDVEEQSITNRHRLLRRGRAYSYRPDDKDDKEKVGLLFMALCADLERQFEFVQRTWINATSFHGLVHERDPLMGTDMDMNHHCSQGVFTIPTAAGPIRIPGLKSYVTTRGGAYFFIPSRSALAHLVTRSTA